MTFFSNTRCSFLRKKMKDSKQTITRCLYLVHVFTSTGHQSPAKNCIYLVTPYIWPESHEVQAFNFQRTLFVNHSRIKTQTVVSCDYLESNT